MRNILRYLKSINSPINAIDTRGAISTRVAVALVNVDLAVVTGSAGLAYALVTVDEILTDAAVLTRIRVAFVQLVLAKSSHIT